MMDSLIFMLLMQVFLKALYCEPTLSRLLIDDCTLYACLQYKSNIPITEQDHKLFFQITLSLNNPDLR